jgi:hypothetical protein
VEGEFDLTDVEPVLPPCKWDASYPPVVRTLWTCEALSAVRGLDGRSQVATYQEATLLSSQLVQPLPIDEGGELHAPCLDLDFPCVLEPSSTPGHHHLYLNVAMPWRDYEKLLVVMRDVGLLQRGFVDNSISRRMTMTILPGLTKADLKARGVKLLASSDVEVDEHAQPLDNEHNREARARAHAAHLARESDRYL